MNIGFIGAGKAGTALGRYLVDHGNTVVGYSSRTEQSARAAAQATHTQYFACMLELVWASDFIFITTSDGAIASVWQELIDAHAQKKLSLSSKIIAHISGCCTSELFRGAHELGTQVCSLHPLLAFGNKETAHKQLSGAHFSFEGDESAYNSVQGMFSSAGNPIHLLRAEDKTRYHAAAVFASNLVLAPLDTAVQLLESCGFSEREALDALTPLIKGNVDNFCKQGAAASLTGPVERADINTVISHLSSLTNEQRILYAALTQALFPIAMRKHPDRDYSDWISVLSSPS